MASKLNRVADYRFVQALPPDGTDTAAHTDSLGARCAAACETAWRDYWRALRLPQEETLALWGGVLHLRRIALEFEERPYLEGPRIALRCTGVERNALTWSAAVFAQDALLARGELTYALTDQRTRAALAVPDPLRTAIEAYEAGAAMQRVEVGDWAHLGAAAKRVREAVFIREQGVSVEEEMDVADADAVHAVLFNRLDQPVGTARLLAGGAADPHVVHIGRMAVHRDLRRAGLGRVLMQSLEAVARERGDHAIVLSAQRHAQHFYEELGYRAEGAPYEEVRIPHIQMRKSLRT